METPNPKCNRCKCYWKPCETDIKSSGLPYKTCNKCRTPSKVGKIIKCICGSSIVFQYLRDHEKTKKHLEFVNNPCVGLYGYEEMLQDL